MVTIPTEPIGSIPRPPELLEAISRDRTRALHAGFQVHVAKPVEPSELIATVASVVARGHGLHS